jgi:HAD domain in Swiss Army Knife RNA repair proteins
MLIFLDFDGVLRRKDAPLYKLERPLVARFEETLRAIPDASVVITSSWREAFSLAEMRQSFTPDIASRIVGVTPIAQNREGCYRNREVMAYLKRKGLEGAAWVALDDDPEHYPAGAPVILVDPSVGFDEQAGRRLLSMLSPS